MARPRTQIPQKEFEGLCGLQCTKEEICSFFNTTDKTLENWCKRTYDGKGFSEVFAEKRGIGKVALRRAQFRLAEKNAAMAIFLGKNYLGQTDNVVVQNQEQTSAIEQIAKALINNNGSDIG